MGIQKQKERQDFGNQLHTKTATMNATETFFVNCEKVKVGELEIEEKKESSEYDPLRMIKQKTKEERDPNDEVYEDPRIKNASTFFFNFNPDHQVLAKDFQEGGRSSLKHSFRYNKTKKEKHQARINPGYKKKLK